MAENQKVVLSQLVGAKSITATSAKKENREVNAGSDLFPGDSIQTPEKTIARLQMYDGSTLTVGQNSRFTIESVQGDPKTIVRWMFHVAEGAVRGAINKKESNKPDTDRGIKLIIRTPVAAMGVRGTKFVLVEDSKIQRSTIYTEEGEVLFGKSKEFLPEETNIVQSGEWAYLESKLPKPTPNKKFEKKKDLEPILDYYQFALADRSPQSLDSQSDIQSNMQSKTEPIKYCIEKQQGWRKVSDESQPHMGECY